ncbi:DUF2283 domain-containing protein [Mycolicibacter sinensis]|uniref:DUF2283 domain-containing protein n=1 Tax=Mycolicibacter sinensis (strain JDM601) TaxID=875328 RepID=A0A1A3U9D6_MYCSD|nr:DUF2283 domain-containing protein [Mycolicibacter sinensis]OBK91491.1 hypothetical protein A5648_14105 [Mycolicibacter sinensis]
MSGDITLSIDTEVDAAYIKVSDHSVAKTIEISDDVQIDIDSTGTLVGVELLDLAAEIPADEIAARCQLPFPEIMMALVDARPLLRAASISSSISSSNSGQAYAGMLQPA